MFRNKSIKVLLAISIVTIILFAKTSTVTAANDQGLEWGIEIDDRFNYDFEVSYHNSTFDLELTGEMYVVINVLGTIADKISIMPNIPLPSLYAGDYTTYWDNDTVMDSFWLGIPFMGSPFAVYPIGNWSLLTELFEDNPTSTITQNATVLNNTIVDVPNSDDVVTFILQKSNGVAISHEYHVSWGETTADVEFTLTSSTTTTTTTTTTDTTTTTSGTNGTTGASDSTLILILGGGAAAIVVIVIVFMRRK